MGHWETAKRLYEAAGGPCYCHNPGCKKSHDPGNCRNVADKRVDGLGLVCTPCAKQNQKTPFKPDTGRIV